MSLTDPGKAVLGRHDHGKEPIVGIPYRARVNERTLLNLPGFHGGAFVYVSSRTRASASLYTDPYCKDSASAARATSSRG